MVLLITAAMFIILFIVWRHMKNRPPPCDEVDDRLDQLVADARELRKQADRVDRRLRLHREENHWASRMNELVYKEPRR